MKRNVFLVYALVAACTATFELARTPAVALAADPQIAAAGDIACDPLVDGSFNGGNGTATRCRQLYTSNQLVGAGLAAVLPLGDLQYECGGASAFLQSYDPSWGRVKSITRPVPGNHEYNSSTGTDCDPTGNAAGYYNYFGTAAGDPTKGYYSFNVGQWHLIALNSNCAKVSCFAGSTQEQWLRSDLAANTATCTLAYWHHPLFSSGEYSPGVTSVRPLFQALYDYNADVVLSGHDHNYERFAPQDHNGASDPARGIRQFIVGTGGKSLYSPQTPIANSQVRSSSSYGVLKMTLHPTSYEWNFVPAAGSTFTDSGGAFCDKPEGYSRPLSASVTHLRFIPAFQGCASANAAHGRFPVTSCSPASQTSGFLTIGTPETNGKPTNFQGQMKIRNIGESPIDPNNGDQSDVTIDASFTDVRRITTLADYSGQLQGQLVFRVTDRFNGATLDQPGTVTDVPVSFTIPCQATADTGIGGTCNLTTSVDAATAGAVREGKRGVWELRSAKVFDGGPDGSASTADNTLFAVPGIYAP